MESAGMHMMCDLKHIQNTGLLNSPNGLRQMMKMICRDYLYTVLEEVEHTFSPQGCTILFLLSESHMSIHTFPEKKFISFDLYTCRQYEDTSVYEDIYHFLIHTLHADPEESTNQIVHRSF